MSSLIVRAATPDDQPAWLKLWRANCAHYGKAMSEADDRELWRRIIDASEPVGALVAGSGIPGGALLGLAHYVVHPHTFSQQMVCYLEDLWVDPLARGAGLGRSLIEALVERGRAHSWRRVYWHASTGNAGARALYDRIARLTDHVRYEIAL